MAKFTEPPRTGTVMGNAVTARPVPFARLREVTSRSAGDETGVSVVEGMCGVIEEYVTLEDGTAIDTSELSPGAIQALYKFATEGTGGAADFT